LIEAWGSVLAGSRDDRSERAPTGPWSAPQGAGHTRPARRPLHSATSGKRLLAPAHTLTGGALEISFVEGEESNRSPGSDRAPSGCFSMGSNRPFSEVAVVRACGNALGLARGLHAHSAVVVNSRSPWRAISTENSRQRTLEREAPQGCVPQGCSRVRREIPPGRTGCIALSSECSYRFRRLHVCRHGIALLSWRKRS
jgi:hypothetical protein